MAVDIVIQQAGTWPLYRLTLTRGADPLPLAGATATLHAGGRVLDRQVLPDLPP